MALTDATTRLPNRPDAAFGIKDRPPPESGQSVSNGTNCPPQQAFSELYPTIRPALFANQAYHQLSQGGTVVTIRPRRGTRLTNADNS